MNLPVLAVLAGGIATRLWPITEKIPKSVVEVAGEPFISHQLRLFRRQGFERIVLLIGHFGEQIEAFVGDGTRFGLSIEYVRDGMTQRGTGGALKAAAGLFGKDVFVTYGDSYLVFDVEPVWSAYLASKPPALMTVLHNRNQWDSSNVIFDGAMVRLHDKTAARRKDVEWIDFGLSIFRTEILRDYPAEDPFDLSSVTKHLAAEGQLAGFEVRQRFFEIGKPSGLRETESYLRSSVVKVLKKLST